MPQEGKQKLLTRKNEICNVKNSTKLLLLIAKLLIKYNQGQGGAIAKFNNILHD